MVSVVILSYNNKQFLRMSVTKALELNWPELEVIVVDNASSDGSPDMIEAEFRDRIRLIRRKHNSPTAGRNEGFNAANGKYILSIDNDIVLTDRNTVNKAVALFDQFSKVALLAFRIGSPDDSEEILREHWWYPVRMEQGKDRFFLTDFFSEGAVFFRADAIKSIGGYDEVFFQYHEGDDLALRLTRDGYNMLYCPNLSCVELRRRGFYHTRRARVGLRNKIWMAWKHYPFWRGFQYVLGRIAISAYRSVRFGWFDYFLKALIDGTFAPLAIRTQRQPLRKEVWQRIRQIERGIFVAIGS
jgi:GT2 family glycosyltransferase